MGFRHDGFLAVSWIFEDLETVADKKIEKLNMFEIFEGRQP